MCYAPLALFAQKEILVDSSKNTNQNNQTIISHNDTNILGKSSSQTYKNQKLSTQDDKTTKKDISYLNLIFPIIVVEVFILLLGFLIFKKLSKQISNNKNRISLLEVQHSLEISENNKLKNEIDYLSSKIESHSELIAKNEYALNSINNSRELKNEQNYREETTETNRTSLNQSSILYAQQPLPNGIFNKTESTLTKKLTIYLLELNSNVNPTHGTFTLVTDEGTRNMAFNTPDTFLPTIACEVRGSGNIDRLNITKGTLKKVGEKWAVDKKMIITFV
jgi:hypothetical protein